MGPKPIGLKWNPCISSATELTSCTRRFRPGMQWYHPAVYAGAWIVQARVGCAIPAKAGRPSAPRGAKANANGLEVEEGPARAISRVMALDG